MPHILKLAPLYLPWLHRLRRSDALKGLNARHLVATDDMRSHRCQERRIGVKRADRLNLLAKGFRIISFGLGIEPVAAAMWLKSGLPLKNAGPNWAKSRQHSGGSRLHRPTHAGSRHQWVARRRREACRPG